MPFATCRSTPNSLVPAEDILEQEGLHWLKFGNEYFCFAPNRAASMDWDRIETAGVNLTAAPRGFIQGDAGSLHLVTQEGRLFQRAYPHTKYRTSAGVAALFQKYELRSHEYLIVVADRLLVLDRLVTGRYWTIDSAVSKARQEATQIVSLIKRIAYKVGAQANGRIVFWDEIADTAEFLEFAQRARTAVLEDAMLGKAIEEFVELRVERFGLGSAPERERGYECEYLLSEVCMSVFCTEVLRFGTEVWERPPAPGIPDPLKLLYQYRPVLVEHLIGRPATRALSFLYADAHRQIADRSEQVFAEG
jgi:hypothetical protein